MFVLIGSTTKRRPTQKTIADVAGLAVTTVSKALAGDVKISPKTREKVDRIAREIGYVPDRAAQRLRTGKTHVISLILNTHAELFKFGSAMIVGLTKAFEKSNYHLVVTPQFEEGNLLGPIKKIVENNLADGIIFSRVQPFDTRVQFLLENNFPFVCHGRTNFSTPHPFVDFDNERYTDLAIRKLFEEGARKICIIPPPESLTFHQHVKSCSIKTANQLGIEHMFADGITLDNSLKEISEWAGKIARTTDRPDGFVLFGEASYFATMNAFRNAGIVRSKDFHVVVKRNSELISYIDPGVSVVFEDIVKAGLKMGTILVNQLEGKNSEPTQYIDTPFELEFS